MKYDNLLKTILEEAMPALVRLLKCAPVTELLTVEFPERSKLVADVVALLDDGKILHIEFQLANDPRMHWRCFHYFGAIQERWPQARVTQVVVYLGNGPMRMESRIDVPKCQFSYEILDMNQIPEEIFHASESDSERVLALLCQSPDPRATIKRVLGSWKGSSGTVLLDNVERLRTLAQLRGFEIIAIEEIERMPFDLDVTESILFKRGETRGEAKLLTILLERRFGPLSDSARQRLQVASNAEIEQWAVRVADARQIADVFGHSE